MTYYFLSRWLYIYHSPTDNNKAKRKQFITFEALYLNSSREFSKFKNTVDSRLLEHSENGPLHKHSPVTSEHKPIEIRIQKLEHLFSQTNFLCYLKNCLVSFHILIYQESAVSALISS